MRIAIYAFVRLSVRAWFYSSRFLRWWFAVYDTYFFIYNGLPFVIAYSVVCGAWGLFGYLESHNIPMHQINEISMGLALIPAVVFPAIYGIIRALKKIKYLASETSIVRDVIDVAKQENFRLEFGAENRKLHERANGQLSLSDSSDKKGRVTIW